jgi:hypothetical protein
MADTIVRGVRAVKQTFRGVSAALVHSAGGGARRGYRSFGLPGFFARRGCGVAGLRMTSLNGSVESTCVPTPDVILWEPPRLGRVTAKTWRRPKDL